jgi:hypothetical protein
MAGDSFGRLALEEPGAANFLTSWSTTGKRPAEQAPVNPGTATTMRPEGGSPD